jgi:GT2 family glycosyltransferase
MHDHDADSVAVIIVNHNGGGCLSRCLSCLAAQHLLPTRIVVFDNGSADGSIAAAEQVAADDDRLAQRIVFHLNGENLGFAVANNRAVAMCDTEFVALLNPDAFPEPGWLAALVAAARQHPEAVAFGSRQMLDGTDDCVDGIGDVYHISGLSWRAGHGCRLTAADLQDAEIFSACAAAALYRRWAFNEVGGFDEDFFCYFEDVDLGFRLRLAGYGARYVSAAAVSHVGGVSSRGNENDFAVFYGHRNLVWCYVKNMPQPLLFASLHAHILQTIFLTAFSVTRGQFRTIVKAKCHAVAGLRKCWQKRQLGRAHKRVPVSAIWQMLGMSLSSRRRHRHSLLARSRRSRS